nr:hypothetical protein HJG63_010251 [Rousettus aegyptiacus]
MGVVECAKHELLQPFNVLYEKEGEFVAQFKFTVLLMPNGPMRITSGPFEPDLYKSEMEVQDAELKALLQSSASRKTQKKKKKKVRCHHPSFGRVNLIFLSSTFLGRSWVQISVCHYFPPSQLRRRELGYICPWSPRYYSKVLETDKSSPSFYEYRPPRLQRMPPVAKH